MGLTLVLDANVNDYSVTNGKFDGFKVIDNETQKGKFSCHVCYRYWFTAVNSFRTYLIAALP